MKNTFALMLSLVCSISFVAAQAPAPAQEAAPAKPAAQQPAAPAAQSASASKVTYVGCLKPGTAADSWVLESAEVSAAGGAASKPAATAGAASSKLTLGLTAKPGENLKPHANHKIEVTGTISPSASASASAPSTPGAGATATAAAKQNLNVESFKMVSATCP